MLGAMTLVVSMLLAGLVVQRIGSFPENAPETLNRFVIQICVPAMVLLMVPKLRITPELAVLAITPWVLTALSIPLIHGACRAFGWSDGVRAALLLCVPLGNTSFIGYPMIGALLGESKVPLAVVFDQLGSFVLLSSYGLVVVARYEGTDPPTFRTVALRMVRFPPFVALLIALIPWPHPAWLDAALRRVGESLVPIAMFAVALKMKLRWPKERAALILGLFTKMVLLPALALAIGRSAGVGPDVLRVNVLEAAMPPMITAGALAIAAGFAPELSAAMVGWGIVLSIATLPLWAFLLGAG